MEHQSQFAYLNILCQQSWSFSAPRLSTIQWMKFRTLQDTATSSQSGWLLYEPIRQKLRNSLAQQAKQQQREKYVLPDAMQEIGYEKIRVQGPYVMSTGFGSGSGVFAWIRIRFWFSNFFGSGSGPVFSTRIPDPRQKKSTECALTVIFQKKT